MYARLCSVDFSVIQISEGLLNINMATDTPGFSHFEITINKDIIYEKMPSVSVKLKSGVNAIEIRSVDLLGNQGSKSILKVNYKLPN